EARRLVVAQMFDYVANAARYWSATELQAWFDDRHGDEATALEALLGETTDPGRFWDAVEANLRDGRVRLLFVADRIPDELRGMVEFLNERMDPTEVLAVEVKQFG